jgi:hypothetical protein
MPYKYIGENYTYHNLLPQVDIELKNGEEYDFQTQSDAQIITINGQQVQTQPNEIRAVFDNGAWIPYMPKRFEKCWQYVS